MDFELATEHPHKVRRTGDLVRIERPITYIGNMRYVPDTEVDIERAKSSWPFLPIYRYWSFGFNREELVKWFDSIPPHIVSMLQRMFLMLHTELLKRAPHTQAMGGHQNSEIDLPPGNPFRKIEVGAELGDIFDLKGQAYTCFEYEPSTQERQSAFTNRMNSFIEHMHREEYLARLANHDMSIPMPPFDFLCFFVNDCLRFSQQHVERYIRLSKLRSASGGAMLVHITSIRSYDAVGRISKARAPLTAESSIEDGRSPLTSESRSEKSCVRG